MEDRNGFIKKVYGILTAQLIVTAEVCLIPYYSQEALNFMRETPSLMGLCVVAAIIIELALICNRTLARTVPINYYLLGAFTLCESYMVSFICTQYDPTIVLISAMITAGTVGGLTYYAWTTKEDYTVLRGMFSVLIAAILSTLLIGLLMPRNVAIVGICIIPALIFGLYIVIDTQMIIGGKRYELSSEDYVLGALILYLDIITLFIKILEILGKKKDWAINLPMLV